MKINKLKIAIIIPNLIIKGGTHKQLLHLAMQLQKQRIAYNIFTFAYYEEGTYQEFKKLKINSVLKFDNKNLLIRFFKKASFINTESFFLYLSYLLSFRFVQLFKRKNYNILNPHDWFSAWIASKVKRKYLNNVKITVMLNDMPPCFYNKKSLKYRFLHKIDVNCHRYINSIVVLDEKMKKKAQGYFHKIKIKVIRSGISIKIYKNFHFNKKKVEKKLNVDRKTTLITCASIPSPHRRFEDAIEAISKINNRKIKLMIIGNLSYNKSYGDKLKQLVKLFHLEKKVIFISKFLPFKKRSNYIASSDIYIFPNENQTWGLGVIESLALKIPCIVSNGAGVSEVLKNGKTALIYNVGNVNELKMNIQKIINNKNLRNRLKKNGYQFVLNNFSWEKYANQMLKVFSGALNNANV